MDGLYYGEDGCSCCARGHGSHRARRFSDGLKDSASLSFSKEVLQGFMRRIYDRKFDTTRDIDREMWQEVLRIVNEGTVEGLAQSQYRPTHNDHFLQSLRHGNEVFAAFKVHTMGGQMAARLYDTNGHLKSFSQWLDEVSSISSHHAGAWLRTEYDTAVIRAHNAADWQQFLQDKDIMPNLRWMPTTSPQPEGTHAAYWRMKLTLPVDDPFWDLHHPGDRWNCKCSLEATDEPVNRPADLEPTQPQRGLENNPGKDGHLFNQTHPYFPTKCSQCGFYRNGSITNRLKAMFQNRVKDCYNCPFIDGCLERNRLAQEERQRRLTPTEQYALNQTKNSATREMKAQGLAPYTKHDNRYVTGHIYCGNNDRENLIQHIEKDYILPVALNVDRILPTLQHGERESIIPSHMTPAKERRHVVGYSRYGVVQSLNINGHEVERPLTLKCEIRDNPRYGICEYPYSIRETIE